MTRKPKPDPLGLSPHWHFDCRLENELPEDNVVGRRFLIHTLFGSAALVAALVAGWMAYVSFSLRGEIEDWKQRIADDTAEVDEVRRTQQEYQAESTKIDRAVALIRTPFLVSGLLADIGRTLPPGVLVEAIEWAGNRLVITGTVGSTAQFGDYIRALQADPVLAAQFSQINQTGLDRVRGSTDRYTFEATLILKSP